MLPNSLVTLLAFLLLVAPGAYAESLYERRRPARTESSLREASRIALSSICFTVASVFIVVLVTSLADVEPSIDRIVNDGPSHAYLDRHYVGATTLLLIEFLLALGLARLVHFWLTLDAPSTLAPTDLWHQVFRVAAPTGDVPYLRVRLTDGWVVEGRLAWARYDNDPSSRELALAVPLASKQGAGQRSDLDARYRWMLLKSSEIQRIDVAYMTVPPPIPTRSGRVARGAMWVKRHLPGQ